MTGGAFGSLVAQFFHLTSAERKTLLVAGAAAGMSATFAAPVAVGAPRSRAPAVRMEAAQPRSSGARSRDGRGRAALPARPGSALSGRRRIPPSSGPEDWLAALRAGLLAGVLSALLTRAVYAAEDAFSRLPIHWMWWPAIGGVVIGVGGLIFPQALGVGYETIGDLLQGDVAGRTILGILIVKAVIWSVSLGSGTSGGVLAPLLMIGGALGGVEAWVLPDRGRWILAARQHGRHPWRDDARTVHGRHLRAGTDARRQHAAAAADRGRPSLTPSRCWCSSARSSPRRSRAGAITSVASTRSIRSRSCSCAR